MKTIVELPEPLFRLAKATAAQRGVSLKDFFAEALREQLKRSSGAGTSDKPWMRAYGGLRDLHKETKRINRIIEREFETIDSDQWR